MSAGTVLMVVTVYSESDPEQLAKRFARLAYLECGDRAEVGIIDHAATGKIILVPPAEPVWPNSGADAIDENPPEPELSEIDS